MRQAQFLKITGGTRNELDGGRRRRVLPFNFPEPPDAWIAGERSWSDFSLRDAVHFRCFLDLTRSGLKAEDASDFVRVGIDRVESIRSKSWDGQWVEMQAARGLLDSWDDEVWIAREIWTCEDIETITGGTRDFTVTWWGGTEAEIKSAVGFEKMGFAGRKTLGLQFYNLSIARQRVFEAARDLELLEMAEIESVKGAE